MRSSASATRRKPCSAQCSRRARADIDALSGFTLAVGRGTMRIRPGRGRSLAAGIGVLLVRIVGRVWVSCLGGMVRGRGMGIGPAGVFTIVWVIFGLIGAGVSFYNAFSREGVTLYEIDMERREDAGGGMFCPQCGQRI